jgi:hypothetical protein
MAFRVLLTDGTHLDYNDHDAFEVQPGGVLIVHGYAVRTTYAPHVWCKVLEQLT